MSTRRFVLALVLLVTTGLAFARNSTPPAMRLGDGVKPLAYELALKIDPRKEQFEGRVEIDIEVAQARDFFWINGTKLTVDSVVLTSGGRRFQGKARIPDDYFIGLQFDRPVPAGRARLAIAFKGRMSNDETRGLFRQQDLGNWYAFTQFETDHARRAFPSFDEPHWKTPWTVTLTVPAGDTAVANAPAVGEQPAGKGWKQVRFAPTQPLPSYLVALGVGPFDIVDGGKAGMKQTPLRYIVPKGRAAQTRYAVKTTPRLVELLENYFGMPYPFDKLDSMVIPITTNFGAMENPGLITYRSGLLLATPDREDERFKKAYAGVGAHEIAHQWFGDLVTMKWWDDIWLNESFATWMARKAVLQFEPSWEPHGQRAEERQSAFAADRLATARSVSRPVETRNDLAGAFSRITYQKGGSILYMYESVLGEARFQEGVRRYLKRHAWGNASADDFFAALADGDAQLASGMAGFVQQPGVPLVDVAVACSNGEATATLRQQRFVPAGAAAGSGRWAIPVCLRAEGATQPACTVLREQQQAFALPKAGQCPAWVLPNPGGTGYYLARMDAPSLQKLARAPLSPPEAIGLLGEQVTLAHSGALPLPALLELAGAMAHDPRPEVATAAAYAVADLHPALFAGREAAHAAWIRENFGPLAARLGWVPQRDEPDAVRSLRSVVLPLVADLGDDQQLRAQAKPLAQAWLAGDRERLGAFGKRVLVLAARDADEKLFDSYLAAVRAAQDSRTRLDILYALGGVRAPALQQRAFQLPLADPLDVRETLEVYDAAGDDPRTARAMFEFVRANDAALAKRLPEEIRARMPRWHEHLCSAADRDALKAFSVGDKLKLPGASYTLAQTLEAVELCTANVAWQAKAAGR
ncbi:M1 family metallopeptidase [Ramlibacter sp. XY19]|uniref:M1 family metallopeptidase n=1 Tax=Ramlibacter paludis TaxID=2908000 RepID=UPI0023DBB28B|nr:M1 family metallopeptidase [Ramlibacter paludis]MCG2595346.1 M1 family metallopeptidase [Ramlibacter paludis]